MLTSTAQLDQPEPIRATVYAGTIRVDYWRGGRGSPVLLLPSSGSTEDQPTPWFSILTSRFRVLAGSLFGTAAEAPQAVATRLRSFLNGLGLERVAVVAGKDAAAEVLWLALSEPERIDRIVILLSEHADPVCPEGPAPDRLEQSRQPILIVRMGLPDSYLASTAPAAEYDRMLRFLSGEG